MTVTSHRAARFVALDQMFDWADEGQHESKGANRSPLIDKINKAAGVPLGSSYCAAAGKAAFSVAGIADFGGPHAASVGFVDDWARSRGYIVKRPLRGDAFCWKIDGDNWPDHFGMVVKVRSWGGLVFTIDTVEANTSSGNVGSQADGGGWYRRRRTFTRGRVDFVRDPRMAAKDPYAPKKLPAWYLKAAKLAPMWAWIAWCDHGSPANLRPAQIPTRVPKAWWMRLAVHKGI